MNKRFLLIPALLALTSSAEAALTTNLAAYWSFEGNTDNHSAANGGSAFNGTLMGNAAVNGMPRAGSGALALDGNGDYLDVTSNVNLNQSWTVSAWFQSSVIPTGSVRAFVFESVGSPVGTGYGMSFGIREGSPASGTGFQLFTDLVGGADPNATVQVDDALAIGAWHHILSTYTPATAETAGTILGYLDGTLQYTLTVPTGDSLVPAQEFHIGTYRSADGRWFTGSIDEVAIWDRALAAGEAADVFTLGTNGQAIPEPAALGLGAMGFAALLGRRRRGGAPRD